MLGIINMPKNDLKITETGTERVLVVGIRRSHMSWEYAKESLEELKSLVDTADGIVVGEVFQDLKIVTSSTFVGKGKVAEIAGLVEELQVDTVVFDDELSPAQNRNLDEAVGAKVLDRTALILAIFAKRARTKEGKLQIELAQLEYRLPRLKGSGISLSQQSGYIGTKGPGETKLEVENRRIREKIDHIRKELKGVRQHRELHRQKREGVPIPTVSLVGYTNVGKSTLLNKLTGADCFVEDKLFATLDPTVRRLKLESGREILMSDTVGFIRRLPHQLVDAFKATFEEVERSDLLLHVVDCAALDAEDQFLTVEKVLREMKLDKKPVVVAFNKCDIPVRHIRNNGTAVEISAKKGSGMEALLKKIDETLRGDFKTVQLKIPYAKSGVLDDLYRHGSVRKVTRRANYLDITVDLSEKLLGRYREFL